MDTRWENFSLVCSQFIDRKEGFYNIALAATKSEKSKSQRSKVTSKLHFLLADPVLTIMAYFIHDYHMLFRKPHFVWLKTWILLQKLVIILQGMCLRAPFHST